MVRSARFTVFHAIIALAFVLVAAMALRGPQKPAQDYSMLIDISPAAGASELPAHLAATAATALGIARQWQPDAALVKVSLRNGNNYAPDFQFLSFAAQGALDVTQRNGRMITLPAGPNFDSSLTPLPASFIDPQPAIAAARAQGMPAKIVGATLHAGLDAVPRWTLQAAAGGQTWDINAITGQPVPPAH